MAKPNYLLAQGEQYADYVKGPSIVPKKVPVYTFAQARARLLPKVEAAAKAIATLPPEACPGDEAVAVATLHHEFLSKSAYPESFLKATGLRAVGSKQVINTPSRVSTGKKPKPMPTAELFVAGPRKAFANLAKNLKNGQPSQEVAEDIVKIEDFRAPTIEERIQPMRSKSTKPLLEAVLHTGDDQQRTRVLKKFGDYLRSIGLEGDTEDRIDAGLLSFVSIRAPKGQLNKIASFSFLRRLREMPRLRQLKPSPSIMRRLRPFDVALPVAPVIDPTIRVAVFDGGIPDIPRLRRYVDRYDEDVDAEVEEGMRHGVSVTSALLFGPLNVGEPVPVPYAKVDHYRVLDEHSASDPQHELYPVLRRIVTALERETYDFVSLSIGPDIPLDDDDIHPWTAKLDPLLSSGNTLAAMAVGNTGNEDAQQRLNRIQPPADCVNAIGIGACDSVGRKWARAPYSSIGHGRLPGFMKPDGLVFGGVGESPFWVVSYDDAAKATAECGTSLAAPYGLHAGIGVRAVLGPIVRPLTIRALLLHSCERGRNHPIQEVGWGRIDTNVERLITCKNAAAHILYQGAILPKKYLRAHIPLPDGPLVGPIYVKATLCFATQIDANHPVHYTRSALEVTFRPDKNNIEEGTKTAKSKQFFRMKKGTPEVLLRRGGQKWETVRHQSCRFDNPEILKAPIFDIHHNPREEGHDAASSAPAVPYGMVISVEAPNMPHFYNSILEKYPKLRPLQPRIKLRIRG